MAARAALGLVWALLLAPLSQSQSTRWTKDVYVDPETCADSVKDYRDYTLHKLLNATTSKNPYEHIVIHDVFHPELYSCMLAHLPKPGTNYGGTLSKGLRNYFPLSVGNGKLAIPNNFLSSQAKNLRPTFADFWREFSVHLAGVPMRDAWIALFDASLSRRFKNVRRAVVENKMYYRLDMSRDGLNYFINPHTDTTAKVITILYYLPEDASHPELGTVAFRSRKGMKDDGRGMTFRPEMGDFRKEFDPVVQGKFIPNTVFAFAPCTSSWHGVYKVTKPLQRDTLQGFVTMPMTKEEKSKKFKMKNSKVGGKIKSPCISTAA